MKKLAVIGNPVEHSKSPTLHEYWYERHEVSAVYGKINAGDEFESCIKQLQSEDFTGVNITVPYKQEALKICDAVDDTAKKIGAVNTIKFNGEKIIGTNTDAYGFLAGLENAKPKSALVLGAGGAARAVVYALLQENIEVTLTNRTKEKAKNLSNMSSPQKRRSQAAVEIDSRLHGNDNISVIDWGARNEFDAELIINTTSLGLKGDDPLPYENFVSEKIYYDLIYNETPFIQKANAAGAKAITGKKMLIEQARKAFEFWFGFLPEGQTAI